MRRMSRWGVLLAPLFLAGVSSADPAFEGGVRGYSLGNQPGNANTQPVVGDHVTVDVNGDGFRDIVHACASGTLPKFSILVNRGDGTFNDAVFRALPAAAPTVAAGDFDADGDQDLAFARWEVGTGNQVYIFPNDGAGNFPTTTTIVVGSRPRDIEAADLDLDGDLDLVTINQLGTYTILRNSGTGVFTPTSTALVAPNQPMYLALGDLTGDGRPELAYTEVFGPGVKILTNVNGNFVGPPTTLPVTGGPGAPVIIADFDGDLDRDLVYARGFEIGIPGSVECFRNNGLGTMAPAIRVGTITELIPNDVAVGDVTGDGIPDLVATGMRFDLGSVVVVPGTGSGAFASGAVYYAGRGAQTVSVADLDNDGLDDVLNTNLYSQSAKVFLSGSGGVVDMPPAVWFNSQFGLDPIAGDLDNDGDVDALLAESSQVCALMNDGTGQFTRLETPMQFLGCTKDVHLADMNNDGILDLLATRDNVCTPYRLLTMRGRGDGTFDQLVAWTFAVAPSGDTAGGNISIATLDWDEDGDLDVAVTETSGCPSCPGDRMYLFDGDGAGGFTGLRDWFATNEHYVPHRVYAGDFDEDGHMDLVSTMSLAFIRGHGDGTFDLPIIFEPALGATWLAVGDVNGDAHLDVAYVSIGESGPGARGGATGIMLGDGNGNFTQGGMQWGPYDMEYVPEHGVALGDVTGDGLIDVVSGGTESCDLLLFRGDGLGGLQKAERYGIQGRSYRPVIADFTGDGHLDVGVGTVATMPITDSYFTVLPNRLGAAVDVPQLPVSGGVAGLQLAPVRPNPATGPISLEFTGRPSSPMEVRIVDVTGRIVNSWRKWTDDAGRGQASWDRTRRNGEAAAPGIYFAQLRSESDGSRVARKFVVLR